MRIAVIGVGRMGRPISERLLAAGHDLVVHDRAAEPVAALAALGASPAPDVTQAAAAAELSITSLPMLAVVEDVILGHGGVIEAAPPGAMVMDMSTGSPELARRMSAAGAARGLPVLDAPVSGGPRGAKDGTLAIMVGGDEDAFARVLPVLEGLAGVVRHMGPAGAGQATKLTNNLLAAAHMAVLAEAVALASREGLDPAAVYDVISSGTGDSRVLRNRFPVPGVLEHAPATNDWAALFPVDLLVKDVTLAVAAAAEHDLDMPITALALERYRSAQAAGFGELDYSAVARLYDGGHDGSGPDGGGR
jgi:3-hydroxyisobutyrate dehydrogenase